MAMHRLVFKKQILKHKESGQTTVEYILLIAVAVIAVNTVFRSDAFKKIFGADGKFSKTFRSEMEYSYRHTLRGRKPYQPPNYSSGRHESYIWRGNQTRFFGAKDKYPKN